jgi:hypothetical protein
MVNPPREVGRENEENGMSRTCQQKKPSDNCNNALASFTPDKWLQCKKGETAGHLFDGLTYLLRAAQEWQVQKDINRQLDGYSVEVFAMDSVFLRTRTLFEFFTGEGRNYCHAQCLFDLDKQLEYPAYAVRGERSNPNRWSYILHVGSMHFQNRGGVLLLTGYDGASPRHLNEMPVDFARAILDVWRAFEAALQVKGHPDLLAMAVACRKQAAADAATVVDSVKNRPGLHQKLTASRIQLTKLFEDQAV